MSDFFKYSKFFGAALILSLSSGFAKAQDVAVEVAAQDVAALSASCTSSAACDLALKALIAKLVSANPAVSFETALASVVAQVSADYNSGKIPANIAKDIYAGAIKSADSSGLTTLSRSISTAANQADRGDPVNLEAVADASVSPS